MTYRKKYLHRLKKKALSYPEARKARHIFPRAYCLAKPSPQCAVFAVPLCDAEPQARSPQCDSTTILYGESVADVSAGDWCALAYVITPTFGQKIVLEKL